MVRHGFSIGKIETPKNGKSRRVDMSQQLLTNTRRELQLQWKAETLRKGWSKVPEWVFISEAGKPLILNHWRKGVFDRALEKAKLQKIQIHDLRHSYASMLIQAGESLAYIRDQIGPHSIKITVDIYAHLAPEGNKEAVDRLDDTATGRNTDAPKKEKELTQNANSLRLLASPTGFEPVLPAWKAGVLDRARRWGLFD